MPRKQRPPGESRRLQLVYYGYVAGSRIALALPERAAYGLTYALGTAAARCSKQRRAVALNLARITGKPVDSRMVHHLVAETYRSYARYWLETFRLVRENADFFLERVHCDGRENLEDVLSRGKGAIVVAGHLGNWDAAGAWAAACGYDLSTVAEVLRPRRMFDFFASHRARLGMTIYPATRGAIGQLVEDVEGGGVVAIVGDRDLKGRGPQVKFFGEAVTFPAGPASVGLRTGVPLIVAGVYGTVRPDGKRGWLVEMSEPIEVPSEGDPDGVARLTQEIAGKIEEFVARRPAEWHVMHAFWPADRLPDSEAAS